MVAEGLETSDLLEQATLWPASNAIADAFGNARVGKRCLVRTGWRLKSNLSADPHSLAASVVGKVYIDRVVALNSIIFRGLPNAYKPGAQLYVVIGYNESRDVYEKNPRRSVDIAMWNNSLPEGV